MEYVAVPHPCSSPVCAAALISEGILVTPTMLAHHRLFVLAEAFESIQSGEAATQAAAQDQQGEGEVVGMNPF